MKVRIGLVALVILGWATPAAADVSVTPDQVLQGESARLSFHVGNDSPTASVTKVVIRFPAQIPIPEVIPLSMPEWAVGITMRKLDQPLMGMHGGAIKEVVEAITWTAVPGGATKPGQASELPFAAGPFPQVDAMAFDVEQTLSDGKTVRWTGAAGNPHPAAVLKLVPAPTVPHVLAETDVVTPAEGDDTTLRWGVGILAAALLTSGLLLLAQRRRNRLSPRR